MHLRVRHGRIGTGGAGGTHEEDSWHHIRKLVKAACISAFAVEDTLVAKQLGRLLWALVGFSGGGQWGCRLSGGRVGARLISVSGFHVNKRIDKLTASSRSERLNEVLFSFEILE